MMSGIRAAVASVNLPVPSLSHSRVHAAVVGHVVAGTPVGEHEVEIAVAVDVAGLEVADAQRHLRQVLRGDFVKRPLPGPEEQPALRLVRRADDDVDVAVAVEVARLDHARQVRRGAEHLLGRSRRNGVPGPLLKNTWFGSGLPGVE